MKKLTLLFPLLFLGMTSSAQNALHFDGIDDHITSTAGGPFGSSARTVEAWIKTNGNFIPGAGGGVQGVIVDWGTSVTGGRSTFNVLWANAIRFEVGGSGLSGTIPVNDNKWHHVAMVYDPSATNTISLYVDGVIDVAGNIATPVNTTSNGGVRIGNRVDGVNHFDGIIDEVRIWNVALSQSQLQANSSGEFCTQPAGLQAYYKLNEGVAGQSNAGVTTAVNFFGGAVGTLQNFALSGSASNWVAGRNLGGNTDTSFSASSCDTYVTPSGKVIDTTGLVLDTIANTAGCDSIMSISVSINSIDTSVSVNGSTYTANHPGATYTWIDCNTGLPIPGETGSSYSPIVTVTFAVVITSNGCNDTSGCRTYNAFSLEDDLPFRVGLYPNPSEGWLHIDVDQPGSFAIKSSAGRLLQSGELYQGINSLETRLPAGLYLVQVEIDSQMVNIPLIVN